MLSAIKQAKTKVIFIGVLPFIDDFPVLCDQLYKMLRDKKSLKVYIYYESESQLFYQSLLSDTKFTSKRMSFTKMQTLQSMINSLQNRVLQLHKMRNIKQPLTKRFVTKQINLPISINLIKVDNKFYVCPVFSEIPSPYDYLCLEKSHPWYSLLQKHIESFIDEDKAGIYHSVTDEEMLVMYTSEREEDSRGKKRRIPRGVFPRKSFYDTNFERYSVWLFVFNRKGQLLLHRRSNTASDNWGLWDKSAGGHVNLSDASSAEAAERELIEELFLPKAELTLYMKEKTIDIINLGDWRKVKRKHEGALRNIIDFGPRDWAYFKIPGQIARTSQRLWKTKDRNRKKAFFRETKFISDAFLFIAPEGIIDNQQQLRKLSKAVGMQHKLMSIPQVLQWIENEKQKGKERVTFTDDLLYIMDYTKDILEEFSEMIKVTFT